MSVAWAGFVDQPYETKPRFLDAGGEFKGLEIRMIELLIVSINFGNSDQKKGSVKYQDLA